VIYAAFAIWLLLILFTGVGIYRLWTRLAKPAWVNWALLPGTVVSEMAYIFGCLITGGEIRRAKLVPDGAGGEGSGEGEPTSETTAGVKYVGPLVAALLAMAASVAAILAVHALLGEPVIREFVTGGGLLSTAALPKELPTSWEGLWRQIDGQVHLLRRMCETWGEVDWLNWRVPLFVYLSFCFAIRLSPVSRPMRATLAVAAAIAIVIALVGLIWRRFADLVAGDLWGLLTYVWAALLFGLVVTLLVHGVAALVRVLAGKGGGS